MNYSCVFSGRFSRNLVVYYIFKLFATMAFFTPIITLFLQDNGMTMSQIYILEATYAFIIVILEVPTGAVADHFGCKNSLMAGAFLITAGAAILSAGETFAQFLVSEIVWAVGASLVSGADSAFLYNSLAADGIERNFKKVAGTAEMFGMAGAAFATLTGGFMAHYSFRLTFTAATVAFLASAFAMFGAAEPPKKRRCDMDYWSKVMESFRFVRKHKLVRWLLIYMAFLVTGGVILFWVYQPYLKMTGLPIAMFGAVFLLFQLTSGVSAKMSHKIEESFGFTKSLIILGLFFVAPFFFMAFFAPVLGFMIILLHQFVRGAVKPIIQHQILKYTWENKRATVLSISSLFSRLGFAAIAPLFGRFVDSAGLQNALLGAGFVVLAVLIFAAITYVSIPKKYFEIKNAKT